MEDFNKILSFILGLIVVVVALVVIARRYDFTKKLLPFSSSAKVTVTPTPTGKVISEVVVGQPEVNGQSTTNKYQVNQYQSTKTPSTIPSTGSPTLLLPAFLSSFFLGMRLRKKS